MRKVPIEYQEKIEKELGPNGRTRNHHQSDRTNRLKGVIAIHDDITIFGENDDDHDRNLIALMERAKQTGLTFNSKKCFI